MTLKLQKKSLPRFRLFCPTHGTFYKACASMSAELPNIDIRPDHWAMVWEILQKHVPQFDVWAFGSRAKWKANIHSDLDLCIISDKPLGFRTLGLLEEDFSESDLPWRVDVVDSSLISESFRKIIERDKVVLQKSGHGPRRALGQS